MNAPAAVGVLVVHNKIKEKRGILPPDVTYIVGEHVADYWNCYPWDARAYNRDIYAHEELARACARDIANRPELESEQGVALDPKKLPCLAEDKSPGNVAVATTTWFASGVLLGSALTVGVVLASYFARRRSTHHA